MTKVIFALILTLITFTLTRSAVTKIDPMTKDMTTTMDQDSSTINKSDYNVPMIMNACNESFRIEMDYLISLNESGSFIDETDKTPKCYIRCVLEKLGIVGEDGGPFNQARAAVFFAGERNGKPMNDTEEIIALCADRKEKCNCERSYQFMKCLMSMEIERYDN